VSSTDNCSVANLRRLDGQCPRTSEGFAVVNFVFASEPIAGLVESSARHLGVAYFSRAEIAELDRKRMLRGAHIERAIDAFEAGIKLPVSLLGVVEASPLPAVEP
jgi:hypothetical protein